MARATFEPWGLIQTEGRLEDKPLQASLHAAQLTLPLVESERHSTVPAGCTGEAWKVRNPRDDAKRNELSVSVLAMKKREYSVAYRFVRQS